MYYCKTGPLYSEHTAAGLAYIRTIQYQASQHSGNTGRRRSLGPPPSLTEELFIVDGFYKVGGSHFSLKMRSLVTQPHGNGWLYTHECVSSTNWTLWVVTKKNNTKTEIRHKVERGKEE